MNRLNSSLKQHLAVLFFCLLPAIGFGQDLAGPITKFFEGTVKPLFPIIVGLVFLVSALMNIGDVWGEHKNWKKYLSSIGIYVGICVVIGVVLNFLLSLSV
ncbi:hypothetical protein [Flexithrix dorotheae]|uniref:hypothetical protein n=1 Tax=Flexithrix dorotheae TaxID=70993 RepID=UPI00038117F0|nr:hypothetical protein [Flexithrix dorotheae]